MLQDLQRVCGTCTTTSRCASDFTAHRDTGRDSYCPNSCTLYALKQEGLAATADRAAAPERVKIQDDKCRRPKLLPAFAFRVPGLLFSLQHPVRKSRMA